MTPAHPTRALSRRSILKGAMFAGTAAAAGPLLSACSTGEGGGSADGEIDFLSLAWQPDAIKANQDIVARWNEQNPDRRVRYIQGDWGSVHDFMLTSFEGGDAPDIFHDSSADLADFSQQGYLADLNGLMSDEFRASMTEETWKSVNFDEVIVGAPFLQESALIYANKRLLETTDGVRVPTIDQPWTWDEFQDAARRLTDGDQRYGMMWTLKSPVRSMLNRALAFDGTFFRTEGDLTTVVFGDAEREPLRRIHDMLWVDESAPTRGTGITGEEAVGGFFEGQYAMLMQGTYYRAQLYEAQPEDFEWLSLPPPVGRNQHDSNEPQTLSISADSDRQEDAMRFVEFFLNPEHQALLAAGDWELPAATQAWQHPPLNTGEQGWDVAESTVDDLIQAPFQKVKGFEEWQTTVAQPAMQEYFSDRIDIDELGEILVNDGNEVLARYQ